MVACSKALPAGALQVIEDSLVHAENMQDV
jgi:hypothetical protein